MCAAAWITWSGECPSPATVVALIITCIPCTTTTVMPAAATAKGEEVWQWSNQRSVVSLVQTTITAAAVLVDRGANCDRGPRRRRPCSNTITATITIIPVLLLLLLLERRPRQAPRAAVVYSWAVTVDLIRDLRVAVVVLIARRRMAAHAVRRWPSCTLSTTTTTITSNTTCIRTGAVALVSAWDQDICRERDRVECRAAGETPVIRRVPAVEVWARAAVGEALTRTTTSHWRFACAIFPFVVRTRR